MTTISVQETFQQTIQGEGYWSGAVVDFIRLHGCPVQCPWCDQEYAAGGKHLNRSCITIVDLVSELKSPRVVISGGEPTIHQNLLQLISAIADTRKKISIETAGIKWHNFNSETWVTLSPKEHLIPTAVVDHHYWHRANEVKIVIAKGNELDYYRGNLLEKPCQHIYLQPEWSQREATIPITLELLKQYPIAKLSLQTHKYIGVP